MAGIVTHNGVTLVSPDGLSEKLLTVDNSGKAQFDGSKVVTLEELNASGDAPIFACRAWVNFDASRNAAGGNVVSVLKNSAGDYTITLATPLEDANYVVVAAGSKLIVNNDTTADGYVIQDTAPTASQVRIGFVQANFSTSSALDPAYGQVAIFR